MFERNNVPTAEKGTIAVHLVMADGESWTGHIITRKGVELGAVLNGSNAFLEFVSYKGQHSFLSRTSIKTVARIEEPGAAHHLLDQFKHMQTFNPYAILGVAQDAAPEDVKAAYHALLKAYHPDRYSRLGLPSEILQYLIAMSKRINAAYTQIGE